MLRTRVIRPGLVTNEELASLGMEAEVLFVRLWMLADREGRLEDRPARIRAEAFPYWPHITVEAVENLLKSLWKTGFIQRYKAGKGAQRGYIVITNFSKHQKVHPHEARSTLPGPKQPSVSPRKHRVKMVRNVITCNDIGDTCDDIGDQCNAMSGNLSISLYTPPNVGVSSARARGQKTPGGNQQAPAPPLKETPALKETPEPAPRKPPASEPELSQPAEKPPPLRKATDWWPHTPDDVAIVTGMLQELAPLVHLPDPDEGIVRQVLDAGNGASGLGISKLLRELWLDGRMRNMHSWGLVPLVVKPWFAKARAHAG